MNSAEPIPDNTASATDQFLDSILADLKNDCLSLPVLPQVATGIYKGLNSKENNAKEIAKYITAEPALSMRILQVANSPLVRGGKQIDNLQYAISRMGNNLVHTTIISFLVKQLFRSPNAVLQQILTELWQHCCHVAAISHLLAKNLTQLQPEDALLAGLLHDIGKLPVISKARQMPGLAHNKQALETVMERLHTQLGKIILETWDFNPQFILAALEHENFTRDSEKPDITDVVLVANLLSLAGKSQFKDLDWNTIPAMKKLNIDTTRSLELLETSKREIMLVRDLLAN